MNPPNRDCRACGNTGIATVPTLACIWRGTVMFLPGTTRISTGAVICDRMGCAAGRKILDSPEIEGKPRQRRLSDMERLAGGVDLPQLLREYDQYKAREVRGNIDEAERLAAFKREYPRMWEVIEKSMVEVNGEVGSDVDAESTIPL